MARGRSVGWIVGCAIGALLVLVLIGAGAGAYWVLAGGAGEQDRASYHGEDSYVALAGGDVLAFGGGIAGPFVVRRLHPSGAALQQAWTWTGPAGFASHPWNWESEGPVTVGELHPATGTGPRRLEIFHDAGRHVASIPDIEGSGWMLASGGRVVAGAQTVLRVATVAANGATTTADVALAPSRFVTWVGASAQHVVSWNGTLQVAPASGVGAARTLGPLTDVVGFASAREEVIVLRDGRLVVIGLASGADRATLDVTGGAPITDGMDDPCLVGSHGGRWVFLFATGLDHVTADNARSWTTPAERTLAAVDAATGRVDWRLPLGAWNVGCRHDMWHLLPTDEELPAIASIYGERDDQGGGSVRGMLAAVDLASGALRWRTEFPGATRSNRLVLRRGAATYVKVNDTADILRWALLRFEAGRLTGARWFPRMNEPRAPAITASSVLADEAGWLRLAAPTLAIEAGEGSREGFSDARPWAIERLSLPPEAR